MIFLDISSIHAIRKICFIIVIEMIFARNSERNGTGSSFEQNIYDLKNMDNDVVCTLGTDRPSEQTVTKTITYICE